MKRAVTLLLTLLLLLALAAPGVLAADEITVYVTVSDNGGPALGEKSGEPMVAVPVTVPKGATVDDVLRGLHAVECNGGTAGYKSNKMEMYGSATYYIETWFGRPLDFSDGSKSVTAWKNRNMSTTLGSTVKDGDVVDVCHQRLKETDSPLKDTDLHTHNQYLNFLLAFGIVGFGVICFFFIRALSRKGRLPALFTAFLCIVLVSFVSEDTLETLAGIMFCVMGFCLLPRRNTASKAQMVEENTPTPTTQQ